MRIDGGCHCGFITYEAEANPEKAAICHCTDCQSLSGSAFRTILPVASETFHMSGEPTVYVKTGDSGNKREQAFCPRCGSAIYSAAPGSGPKIYNIRVGTIRQRAQLAPKMQFWVRSKLSWVNDLASIAGVERQ
jgi:hypothetical protein